MNNLIVQNNELLLDNQSLNLVIETSKLRVTCSNHNQIFISEYPDKLSLSFYLLPNSSITINQFKINQLNSKINIKVNQEKDSNFEYRIVLVAHANLSFNLSNTLHGNNNQSQIIIRCLAEEKGKATIQVDGHVIAKVTDNSLSEDIRILSLNEKENVIIPNILIASDDTIAIHNATIGGINSQSLFYLKSKGLSEEKSISLIKNGFLINGLRLNDKDTSKIKEQLLKMDGDIKWI